MPGPGLGTMEYAMAARKSGAVYRLPIAARRAESRLGRIGHITRGRKRTGERSASKSHATFDAAGAGNVIMAAGLRATAKAVEHPPEPKVGAPVLDPNARRVVGQVSGPIFFLRGTCRSLIKSRLRKARGEASAPPDSRRPRTHSGRFCAGVGKTRPETSGARKSADMLRTSITHNSRFRLNGQP